MVSHEVTNLKSTIKIFADDAKQYRPIKDDTDPQILQNDLATSWKLV